MDPPNSKDRWNSGDWSIVEMVWELSGHARGIPNKGRLQTWSKGNTNFKLGQEISLMKQVIPSFNQPS